MPLTLEVFIRRFALPSNVFSGACGRDEKTARLSRSVNCCARTFDWSQLREAEMCRGNLLPGLPSASAVKQSGRRFAWLARAVIIKGSACNRCDFS